jgi:hypothetical protein
MCVSERAELTHALLSYLFDNAAAHDTLEGIVEWWLLDRRVRYNTTEVEQVLDDFVAKKLILKCETADRRIHYRVNRRKENEIRALLQGRDALSGQTEE